jgi:quinoprotein glucose dehydrogenase
VKEASDLLDTWGTRLADGKVAPELQLDIADALKTSPLPNRAEMMKKFQATFRADDPLKNFRTSLLGGDVQSGQDIFANHTTGQCLRCHKVNGFGGAAGPDLGKTASTWPDEAREHLLESLIYPDKKLAKGFGSVTLFLEDGRTVAGTIDAEDDTSLTLIAPDGRKVVIKKSTIEKRSATTSAMPSMEKTLTPREMRDLVEYLMSLRR